MATDFIQRITQNRELAPYTTIRLGGPAGYFAEASSYDEIKEAVIFAKEQKIPLYVLGGGSNTVFSDAGFSGLVLRIALRGIEFSSSQEGGIVRACAYAGEDWDSFVQKAIEKNLAGMECLSGIPGFTGATPMQNVGAYGQEVSEVIAKVEAIDRETLEEVAFSNKECGFRYRGSRFKYEEKGKYIITRVTYALRQDGSPTIRYPELQQALDARGQGISLQAVRGEVLRIRRKKSMVLDPTDPNTRSCGSFFLNPIVSEEEYGRIAEGYEGDIPHFPAEEGVKIPAAWLIGEAGFVKGYRRGGAGISGNHLLALVNYGATTKELLLLAEEIQEKVQKRFGVALIPEPEIVR